MIPVANCSLTLLETKIPSRYLNIGLPTIGYVQIKVNFEITSENIHKASARM